MDQSWLIVILLFGGLMLIVLEIMIPSFGILGLLSVTSFAGAVYIGFLVSSTIGYILAAAILILVPIYIMLLVKKLPGSRVGRGIFLTVAPPTQGQGSKTEAELSGLVGQEGQAETPLKPFGAVRISGKRYTASADSGFIEQGSRVIVVRFDGLDIIVRQSQ